MDGLLPDRPALVYVKQHSVVIVLNKNSKAIMFTEDPAEIEWFFNWIVNYDKHKLVDTSIRPLIRQEDGEESRMSAEKAEEAPQTVPARRRVIAAHKLVHKKSAHLRGGPKRQLIGEQIGPTRMLQLRLFQTQQEAESWASADTGRRFRFATIGSVGWTRALDEEMKLIQRSESTGLAVKMDRVSPA